MKIRYFAWVRERIGIAEENVDLPAGVQTVSDLLGWLRGRGDGYAHALEKPQFIRVAIDHRNAGHDMPIADAREIGLFPPMTGG